MNTTKYRESEGRTSDLFFLICKRRFLLDSQSIAKAIAAINDKAYINAFSKISIFSMSRSPIG